MSEETISEEQVLHNELSFEINQELIHLMKRIIEIQRANKQLKEDYKRMKENFDSKVEVITKYKEVIEEVRKFIDNMIVFGDDEVDIYFKEVYEEDYEKLLQILDKVKGEKYEKS